MHIKLNNEVINARERTGMVDLYISNPSAEFILTAWA
jgi:hypothetical protein